MYNCTSAGMVFMDGPAGSGFQASYSVNSTSGQITAATVQSPGSGYYVQPLLRISDPFCRCGSSIESVEVISGGSGFTATGTITAQSTSTIIARSFSGTFKGEGGSIKSITVITPGFGFVSQSISWVFKCKNASNAAAFVCPVTSQPVLRAIIGKPGNVGGNTDLCLKFHWASGARISKIYRVTNISFVLRNGNNFTSTGNQSLVGANVTANITGSSISIKSTLATGNVLNVIKSPSFPLRFITSTSTIRGDTTTLSFLVRPNTDLLPVSLTPFEKM
jgi:hypothetical protein